ncbi:MAG: SRPBCC family protein [Bacteroidetes bacterium]|nr:SRPBCC family protein [Bacteroidota bacterium]
MSVKKTYGYLLLITFWCMGAISIAQETTDSLKQISREKIKKIERTEVINGKPEEVFAFMDDIRNTGRHMTESSGAMMGGKLKLEWLTTHTTGLGTKYRWEGKVLGMKMDFTVEVSKWVEAQQKIWGTVGEAKMIVITWFEMHLELTPNEDGTTTVKLRILFTKSKNIPGFLLGRRYSIWCVKSMLKDTKKHFDKNEKNR